MTEDKANILLTDRAMEQIKLIQANDYTLKGPYFRISINGKECDGFRYALGFDQKNADDFEIERNKVKIVLDPFAATYCKSGMIDYVFEPDTNLEGFQFTNYAEEEYHGKFFKDESKKPKL